MWIFKCEKRFTQLKCFVAIPHILLNSFNQIQRKGNPLYESIKARFGTELGEDMFYIPAINFLSGLFLLILKSNLLMSGVKNGKFVNVMMGK